MNVLLIFTKPLSAEEKLLVEKKFKEWADTGIEQGYGEGSIHYYDKFEWLANNAQLSLGWTWVMLIIPLWTFWLTQWIGWD